MFKELKEIIQILLKNMEEEETLNIFIEANITLIGKIDITRKL